MNKPSFRSSKCKSGLQPSLPEYQAPIPFSTTLLCFLFPAVTDMRSIKIAHLSPLPRQHELGSWELQFTSSPTWAQLPAVYDLRLCSLLFHMTILIIFIAIRMTTNGTLIMQQTLSQALKQNNSFHSCYHSIRSVYNMIPILQMEKPRLGETEAQSGVVNWQTASNTVIIQIRVHPIQTQTSHTCFYSELASLTLPAHPDGMNSSIQQRLTCCMSGTMLGAKDAV